MLPALAALLVSVATAVLAALAVTLPFHGGLTPTLSTLALTAGALAGIGAWGHVQRHDALSLPGRKRLSPWGWTMLSVFALFALRTFCFLVYRDGDKLAIGSPNNLGDLSLHMQMARYFAEGATWWPAHPEAAGQTLRYYPGIDLFHGLLLSVGADELRVLVWMGLVGSAAAALALYRWGGSFTLAGFLFSGGFAGFEFFHRHQFLDYQSEIAWKSLPLAIFVTQRPFLYALPAGLLLMIHWRRKFFTDLPPAERPVVPDVAPALPSAVGPGLLPFWVEALLYATLPVFHLFAFAFVSALLGWWFVVYFRREAMRWHLLRLVGVALVPATYQVALMTGNFHAAGDTQHWWQPGWMASKLPFEAFVRFWPRNFGLFLVLAPALWGQLLYWSAENWERVWFDEQPPIPRSRETDAGTAFVLPAGIVFVVTLTVKFTAWEWDNTKLMLWCYVAFLPFLWRIWVRPLAWPIRWPLCALLFFSGAVSLVGGLTTRDLGHTLIQRTELDGAWLDINALPADARFACAPDYNHPLVYAGRKMAMGYDGHLYSQSIDYQPLLKDLNTLMMGAPGWEQIPGKLGVRYLYWGPREVRRWPESTRPWEDRTPVATGGWGSIYEVGR